MFELLAAALIGPGTPSPRPATGALRTPPAQTAPPVEAAARQSAEKDLSDFLSMLLAFEGGAGFNGETPRQLSVSGGAKIGIPVSVKGQYPDETLRTLALDLNYDRVRASNGFSTELSLMFPLARFPTPHTDNKNYLRIYVEPGGGYRFGDGGFGPYASAKVMLALFSNRRLTALSGPVSPFIEIQHRFLFTSLHAGDTRIVFGIIGVSCNHCGE